MRPEDVPDDWVWHLAMMLDHPSVYMGGPSERNKKRARIVLAVVIPAIQAEALERAAVVMEEHYAPGAAAAIRALKEGT